MACPAASLCAGDLCGGGRGTSGRWCFGVPHSRRHYTHPARRFTGDECDYEEEDEEYYATNGSGRRGGWRGLWKRLVGKAGKRRMFLFHMSPPASSHNHHGGGGGGDADGGSVRSASKLVPYDTYTYAQNFDEGAWEWAEPEDLSRSFSARYADPSALVRAGILRRPVTSQ